MAAKLMAVVRIAEQLAILAGKQEWLMVDAKCMGERAQSSMECEPIKQWQSVSNMPS